MNNNKKVSMIIASIAVLVAVVGVVYTYNDDQFTTNELLVSGLEPETVSKPYEYTHWTGVPILKATLVPIDRDQFITVKSDSYVWLERVLDNGISIVSKTDLREFYNLSNGTYYFLVNGDMYNISYGTAKVNLDNHYIRSVPLDNPSTDSRDANLETSALMANSLEDTYNWVQISEDEANDYFNLIGNGTEFNTSRGDVELQYIGKFSEEARSLSYQDIVKRSSNDFVGERDE